MGVLKLRTKVNILLLILTFIGCMFTSSCLAQEYEVYTLPETKGTITIEITEQNTSELGNTSGMLRGYYFLPADKYTGTYEITLNGEPYHKIRTNLPKYQEDGFYVVKSYENADPENDEPSDRYRPLLSDASFYMIEFDPEEYPDYLSRRAFNIAVKISLFRNF